MIDNFDIIRSHLTFEDDFDRYVIHILRRTKDMDENIFGSNESQRLLRTYYIGDLEYLDRKIPAIKELCDTNNARAYILPQVRNNRDCLINLGKLVLENIDNPTIKMDGIVRKAVCGLHKSRAKRFILDLDNDNMIEYKSIMGFPKDQLKKKEWTPEKVLELIRNQLVNIGKKETDAYIIPTKNGHTIVSDTFNVQEAFKLCNMIYEGKRKTYVGDENLGLGECKPIHRNLNGWLIKDGMALLYCP